MSTASLSLTRSTNGDIITKFTLILSKKKENKNKPTCHNITNKKIIIIGMKMIIRDMASASYQKRKLFEHNNFDLDC